jgi:hypothetical protein
MSFRAYVEAWVEMRRRELEACGTVVLQRSSDEFDNPSIQFLVRATPEPELLVWESGDVEFGVLHGDGTVSQTHFDLAVPDELDPLFDQVLSLLNLNSR